MTTIRIITALANMYTQSRVVQSDILKNSSDDPDPMPNASWRIANVHFWIVEKLYLPLPSTCCRKYENRFCKSSTMCKKNTLLIQNRHMNFSAYLHHRQCSRSQVGCAQLHNCSVKEDFLFLGANFLLHFLANKQVLCAWRPR